MSRRGLAARLTIPATIDQAKMSNTATATVPAPAAKSEKAKVQELVFSKSTKFDLEKLASELEKVRGDMGRFHSLAVKHGIGKDITYLSGEVHKIPTPEMGAKLRAAGLITAREAEDIRGFHKAKQGLEILLTYSARKATEKAKLAK
jgi:hypothetical protein